MELIDKLIITDAVLQIGTLDSVKYRKTTFFPFPYKYSEGKLPELTLPLIKTTPDLYYLQGVKQEIGNKRGGDSDVLYKTCVVFDLDIRNHFHSVTDEEIKTVWLQKVQAFVGINAVVFSGNGLHLYFFSSKPYKLDAGKLWTWTVNYRKFAKQIEEAIGEPGIVDLACGNVGRLFRLPESYNSKLFVGDDIIHSPNPSEWKKVEVIYEDWSFFDDSMMEKMIREPEVASAPMENQEIGKLENWDNWYTETITPEMSKFDAMKRLNCKKALERLSGTEAVKGELYRFTERNGDGGGWFIEVDTYQSGKYKACDAWITGRGNIGSGAGKGGGPTIFNWLKYFAGRTDKQALDFIYSYFADVLPKGIEEKQLDDLAKPLNLDTVALENHVREKFERHKHLFTWGLGNNLDLKLPFLLPRKLVLFVGDAGIGKTTMAWELAVQNRKIGKSVCFISLEMPPLDVLSRYVSKSLGITKVEERTGEYRLPSVEAVYRNNLSDLLHLGIYLPDITATPELDTVCRLIEIGHHDLVILDNLSFIRASQLENDTEYSLQAETIQRLLQTTQKANACTILLHHFRKSSSNSSVRGAMDIKGNNDLYNKTDVVVALTREEDDGLGSMKPFLHVFKDREGGDLGKYRLSFEKGKYIEYTN
jgi:archaellum biogenesis ATPase FlaH